jgi:hypothetical protein
MREFINTLVIAGAPTISGWLVTRWLERRRTAGKASPIR